MMHRAVQFRKSFELSNTPTAQRNEDVREEESRVGEKRRANEESDEGRQRARRRKLTVDAIERITLEHGWDAVQPDRNTTYHYAFANSHEGGLNAALFLGKLAIAHKYVDILNLVVTNDFWGVFLSIFKHCRNRWKRRNPPTAKNLPRKLSIYHLQALVGVHFYRAETWGKKEPQSLQEVWPKLKEAMGDDELPIKRHWCETMLGVLAYLDAHDLTRLMTCMRAGFSNVWHIGVFRAIDEYLASYKLGDKNLTKKLKGELYSLVQYIKRKPHKYGHLFYVLCSKVFIPETNGDFVVFCSDFLSCHINPIRSPSDCFQLLVETRVLLAERPVYVADSAFFTD